MNDPITRATGTAGLVASELRKRVRRLLSDARPIVEEYGVSYDDLDLEEIAEDISDWIDGVLVSSFDVAMHLIDVGVANREKEKE